MLGRGERIRNQPDLRFRYTTLVVGGLGLNPVHDLTEVPLLWLLTRGKLLEGLDELCGDDATRLQVAHLHRTPAVSMSLIARKNYQRGRKASEEFRNDEPSLRDQLLGKYNYVLPITK